MSLINGLRKMKGEMHTRYKDMIVTALAQLPVLLVGLVLFWLSTSSVPLGTLGDMRIKLMMYAGKSFIAVYIAELLWSILFPSLDEKVLMNRSLEDMPAKNYNIMYGRLILQALMQIAVLNI